MRKIISILAIIILLGFGLFSLKPSKQEKKPEPQKTAEPEKKTEPTTPVNPLVNLAMQATEPKLLDSINKTSFDLLSKVRPAIVKISKGSPTNYSLGCALTQGGFIVTDEKNLSHKAPIDIIMSTGATVKAKWLATDAQSGLSFLKLEGGSAPASVDLFESFQMGDFLLVIGKDIAANINVTLRTNVAGRIGEQGMLFYLPKTIDNTFVFNTQGQLLGIAKPLNASRDGTMKLISSVQIGEEIKPLLSQ